MCDSSLQSHLRHRNQGHTFLVLMFLSSHIPFFSLHPRSPIKMCNGINVFMPTSITSVLQSTDQGVTDELLQIFDSFIYQFSLVQSLSCVRLFATAWSAASQASLSITNSQNLLKLMSIELVMPSNHLSLCCPFLLPSIFPSIRVFSNESVLCIRGPKYWSFSISPFHEYSGLISFRIDWFDLLAGQGTLKSLLQHHSSKASVHWGSAFF